MSLAAITWCRSVRGLTCSQKAVLYVLCDHASQGGESWPSQKTISLEACCGLRTAGRSLLALEAAGMISRAVVSFGGVIRYRIELPLATVADVGAEPTPVTVTDPPSQGGVPPPSERRTPLVTVADRSVKKRKKKRKKKPVKKRPAEAAGIIKAYQEATGSKSKAWPTSCTDAVEHYRDTETPITPDGVTLAVLYCATWMRDGVALSSVLRHAGKMPFDATLDKAMAWDAKGRPGNKRDDTIREPTLEEQRAMGIKL